MGYVGNAPYQGVIDTGNIVDNAITQPKVADDAVGLSELSATGTPDSSKFLRGDNSWQVVAVTPTAVSDQANISTGYFDVPAGTTAERPVTASSGMLRYNTDNGNLEQYTADGWQAIEPSPAIASVSPTSYNGEAGTVFTINGANFKPGVTVQFITIGNTTLNASTTTRVSSSQLTATTPRDVLVSEEPLTVRVINPSGLSVQLDAAIDAGTNPSWVTASGSLATIYNSGRSSWPGTSVQATDSDSGATISYSVVSGSLPSGLSFNTSTGAITGTPSAVVSDVTSSFTIRASDNAGNTSDRSFSITVRAPVIETYSTPGTYTWTKPSGLTNVEVLAIGAGGGGGASDGAGLGNGGASGGGVYTTVNVTSFSSLSVGVGGGGGGGGDSCDSVATENTGGSAGANGGGRGGNAGASPCSGGGGGGGGWSGLYSGSTYVAVGGGGGGGGGASEGDADSYTNYAGGSQPNGNTGSTNGAQGENYSGDGGGYGGGGGGYFGGVGGAGGRASNGGANYANPSFCSGTSNYVGNNSAAGSGGAPGGNLSVPVASGFNYGNDRGAGGATSGGAWAGNGNAGVLFIKY